MSRSSVQFIMLGLVTCILSSCQTTQQSTEETVATLQEQGRQNRPEGFGESGEGVSAGITMPQGRSANDLFDFSSMIMSESQHRTALDWQVEVRPAIDKAKRDNKLVFILFTHAHTKPARDFENALLASQEFRDLAESSLILIKSDFSQESVRSNDDHKHLKSQFKARGYPNVLITFPDGREILKLSSYKPEYLRSHLNRITEAVKKAPSYNETYRADLAQRGYREWSAKDGGSIFANLIKVDANQLTFVNEWNVPFSTFINRLSADDQTYLEQLRQQSATP